MLGLVKVFYLGMEESLPAETSNQSMQLFHYSYWKQHFIHNGHPCRGFLIIGSSRRLHRWNKRFTTMDRCQRRNMYLMSRH